MTIAEDHLECSQKAGIRPDRDTSMGGTNSIFAEAADSRREAGRAEKLPSDSEGKVPAWGAATAGLGDSSAAKAERRGSRPASFVRAATESMPVQGIVGQPEGEELPLSSPGLPTSENELQFVEDLADLLEDIVSPSVHDVASVDPAEDHALRQIEEVVHDIVTGQVEEVLREEARRLPQGADRAANVYVRGNLLDTASDTVRRGSRQDLSQLPCMLDGTLSTSGNDAPEGDGTTIDWSVVELHNDADDEVLLLTDPLEAGNSAGDDENGHGQKQCHDADQAFVAQLDGTGATDRTVEASRPSRMTGSGTLWSSTLPAIGIVLRPARPDLASTLQKPTT